jgi:iron complex outermembrane receptor protein
MATGRMVGLIAATLLLCNVVHGQQAIPTRVAVNIEQQPLGAALTQFANQTGLQVLRRDEDVSVKGLMAPRVVGEFSPQEALSQLLAGTDLKFEFVNARTVAIRSKKDSHSASSNPLTDSAGSASSASTQHLAQVDQGTPSGPSPVEKQKDPASKKKAEELEEIVVTGSRIPTAAGQQTLPIHTYTREVIELSGQTTMGEFLNTLPTVSTSTNISTQFGVAGMQTVQLHGLPIGTTLTLLDGHRMDTNLLGFFDLSNIPISAVERIEILPVGASAIYGGDALAGAVNIILRKNLNGFEANTTVEHGAGVTDASGNVAWGKSWDRGAVSLITSYQERGSLLGTQREPASLTHFPATVPASTVTALESDICAPGNVYSLDGRNLPGLSSPYAGIPAGITGVPGRQQFGPTMGKLNVCNAFRYSDVSPEFQREGALLSAHYDVTDSMDLFTDILFSHGHLRNQLAPQISVSQLFGGTVAANNPYNPFGQPVNVSFAYDGTGQQEVQSTSLIRPMVGARGSLFSDWEYEATTYFSRDRADDVDFFTDSFSVADALGSSDPATALNPFTSGAPGTPKLLSSLAGPAQATLYNDRIVDGQGILRGPLLHLPAGQMQAVIGTEYTEERQDSVITGVTPILLHRNSYAAFSEVRVPLLADRERPDSGDRLALTLAGRYDHSNDYGGKATWQGGLRWRATETISLSGGYGQSYEAPPLSDISGSQSISPNTLVSAFDPFRGNEPVPPTTFASGPNFTLNPETGNSSTLGLTYSSEALRGLHASITWYNLNISNYIGTQNIQVLLDNPNLFPGAVIRAPATPQDQQQGFLGVITQINDTFYNFGDLRVDGFDADVSYAIDTHIGQFTPSLAIANIYKWQSAVLPSAPTVDAVSRATLLGVGWAPRWKGTAAVAWKRGAISANVAGRYISKYLDYQDFVPNANEIGNTWIIDASARYEIGRAFGARDRWLAGAYVVLGAVNLLNKTPPFSFTPSWYDTSEYDIRGRFLHLDVGLKF